MKVPHFKIQADLLYLDAYFFLERLGIKDKIDAKIIALCWLDFWVEHDTANTEKHQAIKKHLAKM